VQSQLKNVHPNVHTEREKTMSTIRTLGLLLPALFTAACGSSSDSEPIEESTDTNDGSGGAAPIDETDPTPEAPARSSRPSRPGRR
jgi:hypothetical protein